MFGSPDSHLPSASGQRSHVKKGTGEWASKNKKAIKETYTFLKVLGRGATSVVHECYENGTKQKYAVKAIHKNNHDKAAKMEISILLKIDHPNIIKLRELFEEGPILYLVLELVTGGELFDRIVERGYYSERDAANCVRQICDAVSYLHQHDIVHRDLKPENLLYATPADDAPLKIADFGLSKILSEDVQMKTVCGTPGYCAPEILLNAPYNCNVDMWSVGVITYILLCGFEPFYAPSDPEIYAKIMKIDYKFISPWWDPVSESSKDLIRKCLVSEKRLTANEALRHPWVREHNSAAHFTHMDKIQENMKEFNENRRRKFKAMTHVIMAVNRLGELMSPDGLTGDKPDDETQTAATS
ncbi:calcium/calmodulin-dependent protein kinase type IV-like [Anneissia japonica]|uniref:calcium/calmodulin-dependent protein kinase type IV-like n=1 Tax=Anneissia japonica TaxID=1529436 RepID=UPI001425B742|nr:calcium/calmodulin-dependent protein kinase type IV-like [Anneissia japonica]